MIVSMSGMMSMIISLLSMAEAANPSVSTLTTAVIVCELCNLVLTAHDRFAQGVLAGPVGVAA
jgi:hypothetical protein